MFNKSTPNKAAGNKSLAENVVNGAFNLMVKSAFKLPKNWICKKKDDESSSLMLLLRNLFANLGDINAERLS
jgi:hypothetical protein